MFQISHAPPSVGAILGNLILRACLLATMNTRISSPPPPNLKSNLEHPRRETKPPT
jgi:hypothetical protein